MDLILIPVLLSIGGGLIYLSVNGMPELSLSHLPFKIGREPFKLSDWMNKRPAAARTRPGRVSTEDAELVDLMNDMIAVREQLTDLRLARAPRPIRRRQGRKAAVPAAVAAPMPAVTVELNVAVVEQPPVKDQLTVRAMASRLPQPVKASTELPMPKELLKQTTTPLVAKSTAMEKVTAEKPAVEKSAAEEKQTAARRPSYTGHNRRYVRT